MNVERSRRATALDISGWNVVAIETASNPCGSTKNVNASKYDGGVAGAGFGEVADDDQRDLVGGDEAERPRRHREQPPHRGMAPVPDRSEVEAGAEHGGDQRQRHRRDAGGRAESERPSQAVVRDHVVELPATPSPGSGNDSSVAAMTRLGRIGLHAAAKNRRRLFKNALATAVRP